jgi:hypothetical protein
MDASASVGATPDARTFDDTTLESHAETVRTQGWTVVENAIAPDLCDEINDDLLRLEHEPSASCPPTTLFEGVRTTRIYNLLVHGPLYERSRSIRTSFRSSRRFSIPDSSSPRCPPSPSVRRDGPADPCRRPAHPLPKPHPPIICNTMWAITDFTERERRHPLCPGTHLGPTTRPIFSSTTTRSRPRCAKGSVLVWVGSLWHGGGANLTETGGSASP